MKSVQSLRGPLLGPVIVAVAVLILIGHICAVPVIGHETVAAQGPAGESSHDDGLHHWSSCEAMGSSLSWSVAPAETSTTPGPAAVVLEAPDTATDGPWPVAFGRSAERPPLFLLHASFLI